MYAHGGSIEIHIDTMINSKVAILLATYNGSDYLSEQLDSIQAQMHLNWFVIASDDGSSDQTLNILKAYQQRWPQGKLTIRQGPEKGFCQNFLSMACDSNIEADFFAFCDQDDVWLPMKLTVALQQINKHQEDYSYVYSGRTIYVDEQLKEIGRSPLFSFPRTFRNALIQSIAGGNTMVFNLKAKKILEITGQVDHPSHDWWLYQLITGTGGIVYYDPVPMVLYRQHSTALIGSNSSFISRMKRFKMLFQGRFKKWSDQNISILLNIYPLLTHGSRESLMLFKDMRNAGLKGRCRLLEVAGLYRQTWQGTLSLYAAAVFNKV